MRRPERPRAWRPHQRARHGREHQQRVLLTSTGRWYSKIVDTSHPSSPHSGSSLENSARRSTSLPRPWRHRHRWCLRRCRWCPRSAERCRRGSSSSVRRSRSSASRGRWWASSGRWWGTRCRRCPFACRSCRRTPPSSRCRTRSSERAVQPWRCASNRCFARCHGCRSRSQSRLRSRRSCTPRTRSSSRRCSSCRWSMRWWHQRRRRYMRTCHSSRLTPWSNGRLRPSVHVLAHPMRSPLPRPAAGRETRWSHAHHCRRAAPDHRPAEG
jgi:hypothetical protein